MRRGRMDGISNPTMLVDIECFIPHPSGVYSLIYKLALYFKLYRIATWCLSSSPDMEGWLTKQERDFNVYLYTENDKEWKAQKSAVEEVGRILTKYTRGSLLQQAAFPEVKLVVSPTRLPITKSVDYHLYEAP